MNLSGDNHGRGRGNGARGGSRGRGWWRGRGGYHPYQRGQHGGTSKLEVSIYNESSSKTI